MNKRVKMFITSITIVFSILLITFNVFALNHYSLDVDNHIIFDIEDNIVCEIEAISAVGNTPSVAFNDYHSNSKTLKLTTDTESENSSFICKGGNTTLTDAGTWAPWTEDNPATLSFSVDTIYWIYKITNKSENSIQVRVTDLYDNTLLTMNNSMQLTKKFGIDASTTPDQTESGEIVKDQSIYVLIALETTNKIITLENDWNYKLHIEKANASYLMTSWKNEIEEEVRDTITEIQFVGGDGDEYDGTKTYSTVTTYNFGATDKTGQTPLKNNETAFPNVNQITGHISGTTLIVHSKGPIYAPVDSSCLLSPCDYEDNYSGFGNLERISFNNFNTSNVKYMDYFFNVSCLCFEPNITTLDLSNFDTSNVESMQQMFIGLSSLTSLDLSNFDTSNVKNMSSMFSSCYNLQNLNISNFNTSKVIDISGMFASMEEITNMDLTWLNTCNVEKMSNLFQGCCSLTQLDLSGFNTSKVTNMSDMFSGCSELLELDISCFDTSNVTNMNYMFNGCSSLESLDLRNFNTGNVENMSKMFYGCNGLTEICLNSFDTSCATNMSYMFYGCNKLTKLDLSSFYINATTSTTNMLNLQGDELSMALTTFTTPYYVGNSIDISNFGLSANGEIQTTITKGNTSLVLTKASFFRKNWKSLITSETIDNIYFIGGDGKEFEIPEDTTIYYFGATNVSGTTALAQSADNQIKGVNIDGNFYIHSKYTIYAPTNCSSLFKDGSYKTLTFDNFNTAQTTNMSSMFAQSYGLNSSHVIKLKSIDTSNFNTSKVTNMSSMFEHCELITELDVSNFDTSKVTDMKNMFWSCLKLSELDVSGFDTSKVTNMERMFSCCYEITKLDVSNFNTSNATNLQSMFAYCKILPELNVYNFDTSKVTNMSSMFAHCELVTKLDVSNFDTSKVTDMSQMFYICNNLRKLDVSKWNTSNVTTMSEMFPNCYNLTQLDVSNWDTGEVTSMMAMFASDDKSTPMKLKTLDVSNWDTSKVTHMKAMFQACYNINELDVSKWNTSSCIDMSYMFYGLATPVLAVENWDVSKVKNMSHLFNDTQIERLDLRKWNTSSCTIMDCMFNNSDKLYYLDISSFDTSKVKNMSEMFEGTCSLKELDLSHFVTSSCTNMYDMFGFENNIPMGLTKLTLGNWNTSKVTDMSGMFAGLVNLEELDISCLTVGANCNIDYSNERKVKSLMLKIGNSKYPPKLKKLVTPKSVGKDIDISSLGFSQTVISAGSTSTMLTKVA